MTDWSEFIGSIVKMAEAVRTPFPTPEPKPLLLAPWQQALLESEIGGPAEAELWARSRGFSGIQNWDTGPCSLHPCELTDPPPHERDLGAIDELRKITTNSEKHQSAPESTE